MASRPPAAAQPSRREPCATTIPLPMADAARPAHPAGGPLVTMSSSLGLSLALALTPLRLHAEPTPPPATAPTEPAPASEPEAASGDASAAETETEGDDGGEAPAAEAGSVSEADAESSPDAAEAVDAANDAEAEPVDAANDDAEPDGATAPDTAAPGALGPTAAPLRPMQTAAWWTMFGAFAVGTTAGVLAGLAERQEDRATRLSTLFDAETGAQPLYADRKDEYERYLRRGEGYATAALGVGIVAGAATIAAITLFAIDARRQRGDAARRPKEPRRASLRVRGGGMEVRF